MLIVSTACGDAQQAEAGSITSEEADGLTAACPEPELASFRQQPAKAADFAGTWLGILPVPGAPLRIVLNLQQGNDGKWTGTGDSPEQGAIGIPITSVQIQGNQIVVTLDGVGSSFSGELSRSGCSLTGTLTQDGTPTRLVLTRQARPLDYRRPQDPVPPFPYETREVTFPSDAAGVTLAGTLTFRRSRLPVKAVVLITGSGPQNRNEELLNHRPFLVLADALTRANIAVLRYDDRGVGQSTGDYQAATSADFALDARGAVRFLRSQTAVPIGSIGVVGHSEGGMIGPMAADNNPDVDFAVLLAGPGVDGIQISLSQGRAIMAAEGASAAEIEQDQAVQRPLMQCYRAASEPLTTVPGTRTGSQDPLEACFRTVLAQAGMGAEDADQVVAELMQPWMRFFATYDPAPVLRRLPIPVLALNGSLDLQVLPDLNLPVIRRAQRAAGNPFSRAEKLPGLNHLFQHAATGAPSEYARISQTMAPEVLTGIAHWIRTLPANRRNP